MTDWPEAFMISVSSIGGCLLIAVAVWQAFKTWQTRYTARAALTHNDDYRKLAEDVAAAHDRTLQKLTPMATELKELRAKVSELERLLKEVGWSGNS